MNRDLKEGPRSMEARYFDIGVVGRRTGITMKENVKKDADGLDNFDDFWDEGAEERRRTMVFGDTASEEDDLGGEEYYVGTPTSRQSKSLARGTASTPARAFLEQELPSELLSTPTSRRGKNAGLYRESDPSDRVMEDYPSPSFNAVKKRLVFTKDAYDNDDDHDEYSGVASSFSSRIGANRGAIRSPALDKLLNASKEKKAQIQQNTSLSMSPMSPFRDTRKLPTTSTVAPKSKSTTNTAAAATKAIVAAATTSTTSRATTGQRKAFDFGAEYSPVARQGGRSEDIQESQYAFSDDDGEEQDIFRSTTPPRSKSGQTAKAVEASKTPAEFRRKQPAQGAKMVSATLPQKSAPAPKSRPTVQQYSEDDDQGYDNAYEEPDERDANEDRFQFSDEEDFRRLSRRYAQEEAEEDEEEEDEPLVRRNRATKETVPVQQKRTVGAEDSDAQSRSKLTATGSSRAKKDIPKATKKPQQRQPSKAKTAGATSRAKTTKSSDILSEEDEVASEDEDEEGGDGQVPNRSRSKSTKKVNRSRKTTSATQKRNTGDRLQLTEVPVVPDATADQPGVRRSHRTRLQPLEFWRNEKVVLGPSDDLHVPVPSIKAVIRAAPEEPIRLGAKRRRGGGGGKASRASKAKETVEEEDSEEEGEEKMERELEKERRDLARRGFIEDKTPKLMEVIDYKTNDITKRVLAAPKSQMDFREVEGGGYQFHRGLEDTDSSMVSGVMKIKGGGEKPMNSTGGTACTMLFYVLKGIVQVTVNERKFVVSTGAQFVVPRGNQYSIANLSRMESHLYFVQAKTSDSEAPVPTASQGRPQSQISSFFH